MIIFIILSSFFLKNFNDVIYFELNSVPWSDSTTSKKQILFLKSFQNVYKTGMGQSLDLLSTNFGKKPNLSLFTMDRYNAIVKYKTAYYSFVMPVTLAMYLVSFISLSLKRKHGVLSRLLQNLEKSWNFDKEPGKPGILIKNLEKSWNL